MTFLDLTLQFDFDADTITVTGINGTHPPVNLSTATWPINAGESFDSVYLRITTHDAPTGTELSIQGAQNGDLTIDAATTSCELLFAEGSDNMEFRVATKAPHKSREITLQINRPAEGRPFTRPIIKTPPTPPPVGGPHGMWPRPKSLSDRPREILVMDLVLDFLDDEAAWDQLTSVRLRARQPDADRARIRDAVQTLVRRRLDALDLSSTTPPNPLRRPR